jgi:hypothetical protein
LGLDAVAHHIIKLIERGLKAGGYGVSREGGSLSGEMIDPTEDEISFLQKLVLRGGELTLQGNLSLLKIDRLIPEYVTHVSAGMDTGVFTLTEKGWELARKYPRG